MANAMIKHAELPHYFTVYAVVQAARIHNAVGRAKNQFCSPHERLFNSVPDVSRWHAYGDIAACSTAPV